MLVVAVLVVGALNFPRLPLIHDNPTYQADFADAGGLQSGDIVTVNGVKVGSITAMALDGNQVRVTFTASGTTLGSSSSASAEVLSPVGTEYMQVSPSGSGSLHSPIPLSRTSVPYNLVTALSGLGSEIQHYNIPQLENALDVGSQDLNGTNVSQTTSAFQGLADISRVIGNEGPALATIVSQGAKLSSVLSQRSQQLFNLFGQSDLVLSVLQQRRAAINQLLTATSTLSQQITSLLSVNKPALEPPPSGPPVSFGGPGQGQQRFRTSAACPRRLQSVLGQRLRIGSICRRLRAHPAHSRQRLRPMLRARGPPEQ